VHDRQVLMGTTLAHTALVLSENHIQTPMKLVLYLPVPADRSYFPTSSPPYLSHSRQPVANRRRLNGTLESRLLARKKRPASTTIR